MSIQEMSVVTVKNQGRDHKNAYEASIDLAAAGNSPWLLIPSDVSSLVVTVQLTGAANAEIETTSDLYANVLADTGSVVGISWDLGVVTTDSQDSTHRPPTAIRLVQTNTGTAIAKVRAQ